MKIKEGYVIKKLGTGYVVVTVGEAGKEFNGLIRLNRASAFLWDKIQEGADTREKLVKAMTEYYEGLDEETARQDLEMFLENVKFALTE